MAKPKDRREMPKALPDSSAIAKNHPPQQQQARSHYEPQCCRWDSCPSGTQHHSSDGRAEQQHEAGNLQKTRERFALARTENGGGKAADEREGKPYAGSAESGLVLLCDYGEVTEHDEFVWAVFWY
jgi:hypothetical protein